MLTTMFYYDYYRPYILPDTGKAPARRGVARQTGAAAKPVRLNKTFNSSVLDYARDVSKGVNDFREATRDTIRAIEHFDRAAANYGADVARRHFAEGAADFARAYNAAGRIMAEGGHSSRLIAFRSKIGETAAMHGEALASVGLTFSEDGATATYTQREPDEGYRRDIEAAKPAMQAFREDALELLRSPLTEHMDFRSFRYYYNYNQGVTQAETFNNIGAGNLVDIAL